MDLTGYRKLIVAVAGVAGLTVMAVLQVPDAMFNTAATWIAAIIGGFYTGNIIETKIVKPKTPEIPQ